MSSTCPRTASRFQVFGPPKRRTSPIGRQASVRRVRQRRRFFISTSRTSEPTHPVCTGGTAKENRPWGAEVVGSVLVPSRSAVGTQTLPTGQLRRSVSAGPLRRGFTAGHQRMASVPGLGRCAPFNPNLPSREDTRVLPVLAPSRRGCVRERAASRQLLPPTDFPSITCVPSMLVPTVWELRSGTSAATTEVGKQILGPRRMQVQGGENAHRTCQDPVATGPARTPAPT